MAEIYNEKSTKIPNSKPGLTKTGLILFAVSIFGCLIISTIFSEPSPTDNIDNSNTNVKDIEVIKKNEPSETLTPTSVPTLIPTSTPTIVPTKELSISEKIENTIRSISALKGNSNMDKPMLKDFRINDLGGTFDIQIEMNANDNFSSDWIKTGIESDMGEIYYQLYKTDYPISSIRIAAFFPFQDKYGNASDEVLYQTTLPGVEADKINWELSESNIINQIIPDVWTVEKNNF